MMTATLREVLRWFGWVACALWLGYGIYHEVLSQDPSHFGFRAPVVEAEMKACISDDPKTRYECKEQAILANQRLLFVEATGRALLVFAPPILVWLAARRLLRPRGADPDAPPPPSIQKWRVK